MTHWELGCKLKTTGCEPGFWKHGEVSGRHSVLVAGSFTKDRMLRLDSEASRKVCWEEEEWQRSTLGTGQTVWGDTESSHWLPLTVLPAALQLASDWFCPLRKHSSVINLRKMEIVMLGVPCVHQSVPTASALLQFLLLPRLHWSFLFSRLDPLDPVVSVGASISPISVACVWDGTQETWWIDTKFGKKQNKTNFFLI